MTPSNANTSGLEVVAWRRHDVLRNGAYFADRKETAKMWFDRGLSPEPLVTAASAQARIAELKAERDEARRRRDEWMKKAEGYDAVRLALREKVGAPWPPNLSRALWAGIAADEKTRATAAEARTDRLAKALREIADLCPATCETTMAHNMAQIAVEALRQEG